jgi:hypothetical protein
MTQTKNPHSDVTVGDPRSSRPGPVVTAAGVLMALWCLGFAAVNIVFEVTGHFVGAAYGHYASGISVVDRLAAGLKVLGAVVALLSVARRPRLASSGLVTVLVWAAFATLGVYFLVAAVGYGVLAISHCRRHPQRKRLATVGVLGAPVVFGLLLLGIPALLAAFGLLPGP